MTSIVFIRHAEPLVTDRTSTAQWALSDKGRLDAGELGRRLAERPTPDVVWTSPERKARETAGLVAPTLVPNIREELGEVKRSWYSDPDELAGAVASYLTGGEVEGWERRDVTIDRIRSLEPDFRLWERSVVVSHGILMTTWLDLLIGLDDPFSFWSDLRMPDAWELSLEAKSFERVVSDGRPDE